jgi:hypothetical protein
LSDLNDFIKNIEKQKPTKYKHHEFIKGDVPILPIYKKRTLLDEMFGKPIEGSRHEIDGYSSLVGVRCKTCGTLQWAGPWHILRKERCKSCEGILYWKTKDERDLDWKKYWEMKPLETAFNSYLYKTLTKFFTR